MRIFIFTCLSLLLFSCVSKKKYVRATQKYQIQDSLRAEKTTALAASQQENKQLLFNKQELENKIESLQGEYVQLQKRCSQTEAEYTATLKQKQAELDNKKKILEAFSSELEERESKVRELNSIIDYQDSVSKALFSNIEDALINFGKDELTVEQKDGKVYVSLSEQLLFKSGSATVNNKGRQALLNLAEVLKKQQDIQVMIEGHTDDVPIRTPKYEDNWDLSVMRATEVVRILVWGGKVAPERLIASGRASYLPVASNKTPEGRTLNRRTEIILTPNLGELMELLKRKD